MTVKKKHPQAKFHPGDQKMAAAVVAIFHMDWNEGFLTT
jgi:hypothetical protein